MTNSRCVLILLAAALSSVAQVASDVPFREPMDISGGAVRGVSCTDAADLTGNGLLDIAVVEEGKHAGGGSRSHGSRLPLGPAEQYRNGKPHELAWYRNPGGRVAEARQSHCIAAPVNNLHTVKLGEVNGDGFLDVIMGQSWGDLEVRLYLNDGQGHFLRSQRIIGGKGFYSGVVADMDGDGDLDLIGQDTYARESEPCVNESLRQK